MNLPQHIKEWYANRNVSEQVLKEFNIGWNGYCIVIPIYSQDGKYLFSKYRRDPARDLSSDGSPKYMYDKGGRASLYGIDKVKDNKQIFIVEGENEVLCLHSIGFSAVSSTGGAGTFLQNWIDFLKDRDVYICLDADEPGVKGAIKIQQRMPLAKWVALKPSDGKDATEYIQKKGVKAFLELVEIAVFYNIPEDDIPTGVTKKFLESKKKEFGKAAEQVKTIKRADGRKHLSIIHSYLMDKFDYYTSLVENFNNEITGNDLFEIKRIPITQFLAFNKAGFTKCLWHNENTPSLKYFDQTARFPNTVYCFGACQRTYDVINVVQQQQGCTFKEAVERLKT